MSLTGSAFLILMCLVTVAAFIGATVAIPLIRGKRWVALTLRGLVLLVLNAFVLLTVGIVFNDTYGFYADWTDLGSSVLGTNAGPPTTVHVGGSAASAARAYPHTAPVSGPPTRTIASGQILSYEVFGPHSGLSGVVMASLPQGYYNPANAHRHYPVIETFPGYPGGPAQWYTAMNLAGVLSAAQRTAEIGPVITISPTMDFPVGIDTECVNGPRRGDPKVETWLTKDVPSWAEQTFRVSPDRTSWATLGMSAGAWCSAMVPMLHPAQYAAGIVLGGYFHPDFTNKYRPFGPQSPEARRYDLVKLAHDAPPPVALWLETSREDHLSYRSSAQLLAAARAPLSIQATVLRHAGHRMSVWTPLLPKAFAWLGKNIPGFHPLPGQTPPRLKQVYARGH